MNHKYKMMMKMDIIQCIKKLKPQNIIKIIIIILLTYKAIIVIPVEARIPSVLSQ